jgi:GNAT superfamily N-acetyltransferase
MPDPTIALHIRPAGPADLSVIVEFNRRLALETEAKTLDPTILEAGVSLALADPQRLRYWIADVSAEEQPIGQAAVTREWSDWRKGWIWWLQSVYVAQPYRGRGVFRALYNQIRGEARSLPDVIGLRLYVADSNEQAQRIYAALGMKSGTYSVCEDLWIPGLR